MNIPTVLVLSLLLLFCRAAERTDAIQCFLPAENVAISISEIEREGESKMVVYFHWEDKFNREEKNKLKSWLNKVTAAVAGTLGNYPFPVNYYMYRKNGSREPVPWAHTERGEVQGVNFYVNPGFSEKEFLHDWTAPHEISHLALPFPGRENAWFSEGFATYMQGKILIELGEFSPEEIDKKMETKIGKFQADYRSDLPFPVLAGELKSRHKYPQMYWGGATFFKKLDELLMEKHQTSLLEIMPEYLQCCRLKDRSPEDIVHSIDRISGDTIASYLWHQYLTAPAGETLKP